MKQLQQNLRMVKALIEDDEKRRGATPRTLASRFTFPSATGNPVDSGLLSPLSAPAITPHIKAGAGPSPAFSATFSFSTEAPTPASANAMSATAESLPPLPERVFSFYAYARQRVGEIERQLALVQRQYAALQRLLLWEDAAWESLYGLLAQFVDEWLACEQEHEMQRQAEVRRQRQLETTEAMQRKKAEASAKKGKEGEAHKRPPSGEWPEETKGDSGSSTPPAAVFSLELDPVEAVDHDALE